MPLIMTALLSSLESQKSLLPLAWNYTAQHNLLKLPCLRWTFELNITTQVGMLVVVDIGSRLALFH